MTPQQTIRAIRNRIDFKGYEKIERMHYDLSVLKEINTVEATILARDLSEAIDRRKQYPFKPYKPEFEPKPVADQTDSIMAFNSAPGFTITE